jgi:hypothetical protein
MFKRHEVHLLSNPTCSKSVTDLTSDNFQFYDKDGFELNQAEQKFYRAMKYPIDHPILNHCCWQEPWFELERSDLGLVLDHSMFLCRCNYEGEAEEQLKKLKDTVPTADYLLRTKRKWGFDFALDAVAEDGTVYEVLHIEYDHNDFDYFKNHMIAMEFQIRHKDWLDCAQQIWQNRDRWQHLKGFQQNDWKSEFLLGWSKSEYTEKAV